MQLSRRGFLGGVLAVVSAPAIVRVESLMALPKPEILIPQVETAVEYALRTNPLLTMEQITREAVTLFRNSNAFLMQLDNEYARDFEFMQGEQWLSPQLKIRPPQVSFATWSRNVA